MWARSPSRSPIRAYDRATVRRNGAPAPTSGKYFAYLSIRHHGEDAVALLVKTGGEDEMAALIEAEPDIYCRPAYYGAAGWSALRLDRPGVDWVHVEDWLSQSWRAVAPKRSTRPADAAAEF